MHVGQGFTDRRSLFRIDLCRYVCGCRIDSTSVVDGVDGMVVRSEQDGLLAGENAMMASGCRVRPEEHCVSVGSMFSKHGLEAQQGAPQCTCCQVNLEAGASLGGDRYGETEGGWVG